MKTQTKTKEEKIIKLHWSVWLAFALMFIFYLFVIPYTFRTYETEIREIELKDSNYIIRGVKILGLVCSEEVYVSRHFTNFIPLGNDYAYLSTWKDGEIPHSEGVCYAKIKRRTK
jgi:hypothetical protein